MLARHSFLGLLGVLALWTACQKDPEQQPTERPMVDSLLKADIVLTQSGFDYQTTRQVSLRTQITNLYGQALSGVYVEVYDQSTALPEDIDTPAPDHQPIFKGVTNQDGVLQADFPLATYAQKIYICPRYIGVPDELEVSIVAGKANADIQSPLVKPQARKADAQPGEVNGYRTLGGWDAMGLPDYLEMPSDLIENDFLARINASLPERKKLPLLRPELFDNQYTTNLSLDEDADVWVTFLHEGASWKNGFGFYTYPADNPPSSPEQIEDLTIVFPNASYKGSGGSMSSGNKVKLGRFKANTVVAWFVVAQGWKNETIGKGAYKVFSDNALNPETDPALKQHSVLLFDEASQRFVIGFEDVRRDKASCDQDFNDVVFYATIDPLSAIEPGTVADAEEIADQDKDNIADALDEYPTDPRFAFNNHYQGTLAYEDLWPNKGDYDFNDLVLQYDINQVTNAQNQVARIVAKLRLLASGAGYHNGFAFELPIPTEAIASITGQQLTAGLVSTSDNGTELGSDKAIVFAFDDFFDVMPGKNVHIGAAYVEPAEMELVIELTAPIGTEVLGMPPYNPFIFANATRGREVHLPGYAPTALANPDFFGKGADATDPAQQRYYKTATNLPWGLHLAAEFAYPAESQTIEKAYPHFTEWAESDGAMYPDWYLDLPGYRNYSLIYTH